MKTRKTERIGLTTICLLAAAATALAAEPSAPAASPGGAAQPPPDDRVTRLGELVVVASRETRDPLAVPTIQSAALDIATTTVDAETIRMLDAGTLTEAMDFAAGIFTEERGRKEKQLTSFRGQIYPYPDFALNGVWQRSFWEVPSFFPAAAIDRIEILRSGGAIMVGPNSGLVGAINVVTRRFDDPTTLFDVQSGSQGTFRSSLVHGNRTDEADYTVGVNHYSTRGPSGENAAERFTSVFGAGGWDAAENLHLEFTGFALRGERELRLIQDPGLVSLQKRTEEYNPYTSYGGILRALVNHDDIASTELDAGYVFRDGDYRRLDPGKPWSVNREYDWEYNAGVIHARRLGDANTVRLGAQYNHWVCPDGKRDFVGNRMDVETFSGVLADEHQWDRLTLDGGVRATRTYYRDYTESSFTIAGANLKGNTIVDEWGDPALTGTLGARYRLGDVVSLYGHAAAGSVDAPPGAVPETASELDRETRAMLDGGVSVERKALGMLKAGVFATLRRDAILLTQTRVTDAGDTFNAYANNDVRQHGIEIEFRSARIADLFSVFGNATAMTSEQKVKGDWSDYREIPELTAVAGVNGDVGRLDFALFGKYVSAFENKRFAEDGTYKDLGDFVDLNLTTGVSLGRDRATRLYASLENLLDDEYSTVVGYPDYGFQAFAGLQHRF